MALSQTANDMELDRQAKAPVFNAPAIVLVVIAVLTLIHAALQYAGEDWRVWSDYALAFYAARYGSETEPMIPGSQMWTLFTYALLHADWTHLLFNCLWLLIFGTVVARYLGAPRFLLLAALSAVAGAILTLLLHWGEPYLMIGASGAVSGSMGAAVPIMYGSGRLAVGWPTSSRQLAQPLGLAQLLRNRNALIFTAVWLAITAFSGATGFTGNSFMAEGGIAWEAHIGGFIGGIIGFYFLRDREVRS